MAEDWPPRASVFTPFFRRFADEGKIERDETLALYNDARAYPPPDPMQVIERTAEFLQRSSLRPRLTELLEQLVRDESWIFWPIHYDFNRMNMKETVDAKAFMRRRQYFNGNSAQILQLMHEALVRVLCGIDDHLPQTEAPSPFTIPLFNTVPIAQISDQTFDTLKEEQYLDRSLFLPLMDRLYRNLCEQSGIEPYSDNNHRIKRPSENEVSAAEVVDRYLAGTRFQSFFKTPVPLKFTADTRMNHMHILGGTGAGKTTLIENLIKFDLDQKDPPGMVLIDGEGDLIRKLSRLNCFHPEHGRLRDRIILINPKDIHNPPALNVFDLKKDRFGAYDEVMKEQVTAGVIQTFDYLFNGLLGADLTAKQGVFFKYIARLMLALPEALGRNATILDMMNLMSDHAPYKKAIDILPPIQRAWFEKDFRQPSFNSTRDQIRYRLAAILENPTIARLFTQPETKIDLFAELNRGAIILVDTGKDFLKDASPHFGRIFISLVLQSRFERAALPADQRKDTYLVIDEAGKYFDTNIDEFLTSARKYRCGCVFAHQYLEQATPFLRASLAANTGSKFVSRPSDADARIMSRDMGTTPRFIMQQPSLQFAAYIRDVTPSAVSIPVQYGRLKDQMDERAYEVLLERNRNKVSLRLKPEQPPRTSTPDEDEDVSPSW